MKFCDEERHPKSIDDIMDWFYYCQKNPERLANGNLAMPSLLPF